MCSYIPNPVSMDTELISNGMQRLSSALSKCSNNAVNVVPSSSVIV